MSSVIDFLEKMGGDARWLAASEEAIALALAETGIEEPICAAIARGDASALQALLNQPFFLGMQIPVAPEEEDEEDEEAPDQHPEPQDILAAQPLHA
jgi:hypothetical protein